MKARALALTLAAAMAAASPSRADEPEAPRRETTDNRPAPMSEEARQAQLRRRDDAEGLRTLAIVGIGVSSLSLAGGTVLLATSGIGKGRCDEAGCADISVGRVAAGALLVPLGMSGLLYSIVGLLEAKKEIETVDRNLQLGLSAGPRSAFFTVGGKL